MRRIACVLLLCVVGMAAPIVAAGPAAAAGDVGIQWVNAPSNIGMLIDPVEYDLKVTGLDTISGPTGIQLSIARSSGHEHDVLNIWEFTGGAWQQVDATGLSVLLPDGGTPDSSGTADVRLAVNGGNDGVMGPHVLPPAPAFALTASVVALDGSGHPSGDPLATADHAVTAELMDARADWPAKLTVGEPSVFRVDYVNDSSASVLQPIEGLSGDNVDSIKSPELFVANAGPAPGKTPDATLAWSSSSSGPWHAINSSVTSSDGVEFFLPALRMGPHSTSSIWLRFSYQSPSAAHTLSASVGWFRAADIIATGQQNWYRSQIVAKPSGPTLPVTGSRFGLTLIVGVGLVLAGLLIRVLAARRR